MYCFTADPAKCPAKAPCAISKGREKSLKLNIFSWLCLLTCCILYERLLCVRWIHFGVNISEIAYRKWVERISPWCWTLTTVSLQSRYKHKKTSICNISHKQCNISSSEKLSVDTPQPWTHVCLRFLQFCWCFASNTVLQPLNSDCFSITLKLDTVMETYLSTAVKTRYRKAIPQRTWRWNGILILLR